MNAFRAKHVALVEILQMLGLSLFPLSRWWTIQVPCHGHWNVTESSAWEKGGICDPGKPVIWIKLFRLNTKFHSQHGGKTSHLPPPQISCSNLSSQILTPPTASQGRGHFSKWKNCSNSAFKEALSGSLPPCTLSQHPVLTKWLPPSWKSYSILLGPVYHEHYPRPDTHFLHHLPYSVLTTSTLGKNNRHFWLLRLAAQPGLYLFCTAYIVGEAHKSLSVKSANSGVGQLEFKSDSQPLLCVWAWTWFLISVSLSFLFYMDTVIVLNL